MVRTVTIFTPGRMFPSVSVTGSGCSLMCDHCRGHYLTGMRDVSKDRGLLEFAADLWSKGGIGFLLSGGCDRGGSIPYSRGILDQIREIKRTTGLLVNAHTGLIDEKGARDLADAGVDCFSFDVMADREILREVFHLQTDVEAVRSSLHALAKTGVRTVPHILAGLKGGLGEAEDRALEIVGEITPAMAVLIIHIPTKGTPLQHRKPPSRRRCWNSEEG